MQVIFHRACRRVVRSFAVAAIVASTVIAAADASGAATRSPAVHKGGNLTFTIAGLYATLDPAASSIGLFTGAAPLEAVFGPGLDYVNATTGAIEMGQAKSITGSHGGKVWLVVLHPNMKFSDGTPFNAAAVCNQITHDANPGTASKYQADASKIRCAVVNKTTAKMTLQSANYYFPAVISQDFPFISSPTALAAEGANFAAQPVGAGPFILASTVQGVSQTFTPNKYYKLFAPGQPYLSSFTMEASGTLSQIVSALQSGQAQMTVPINSQYATEERAAGMTASVHATAAGAFLALNTSTPPFNNLLAREAVWDVINRAGVSNVWAPGNPVTTNLFPTTSPFYNKKYNYPSTDLTKAQAIFNQLAAAGTPVKFTILWPNSTAPTTPSYIQSLFANMQNVTVSINEEPQTQYSADSLNGNFQMTPDGLYNTALVPGIQQLFETGGNLNYMHWSDAKADKALEGLYGDKTFAAQQKDWDAFMTEMNSQYPVIWTQQGRVGVAYNSNRVGGIKSVEFGNAPLWGGVYLK